MPRHRTTFDWAVIGWSVLLVIVVGLCALGMLLVVWVLLLILSGWLS